MADSEEIVEQPETAEVETPEVDHSDRRASIADAIERAGRARDEYGRFAAKDEKPEQVEQQVEKPAEPVAEPPKYAMPKTWRQAVAEQYASVPDEIKAEIARREEDFHKGLEPYRQSYERWNQLQQALQPFGPVDDPVPLLSSLMQSHQVLTQGSPEQKARAFQVLAQQYGVDLSGGQPQYNPMYETVQTLQQQVEEMRRQAEQQADAQVAAQLEGFAKDKPHFDAVRESMAALLQTGRAQDLETAYEAACWADPDIRSQLLREQQQKAEQERKAKEAEQARRARTASASVNGAPVESGSLAPDPKDRRAVIAEAIRQRLS